MATKVNKIYGYTEPHTDGLIKIGQTTANDVEKYIRTKAVQPRKSSISKSFDLLFQYDAIKDDGTVFLDHDIHTILNELGYPKQISDMGGKTEEFRISESSAKIVISEYILGKTIDEIRRKVNKPLSFGMRQEQSDAVDKAYEYFLSEGEGSEFLWNAKMRFGKTFAAYQLALKSKWKKVLILTYKPSVLGAWKNDLLNHEDFDGWEFISRDDNTDELPDKFAWFVSYQDILGEGVDSDIKEKHKKLFETEWDCIFVDEYHYGAWNDNSKEIDGEIEFFDDDEEKGYSEESLKKLKTKHRLFLSGTPFKVLASGNFNQEQIFTWTYADEQRRKMEHKNNPKSQYACLPNIELYAYKLDDSFMDKAVLSGKDKFSLNAFFKASQDKNGEFIFDNENAVKRWLKVIRTGNPSEGEDFAISGDNSVESETYPYCNKDVEENMEHTIWYMDSVASCFAMQRLLENDRKDWSNKYKIITIAGDRGGASEKALETVCSGIEISKREKKTIGSITLTCGKLMTGSSVPEWGGILFLRNLKSAETYFQAAFRVQTPYVVNGHIKKTKCCIFDFSPSRSLTLIKEYSTELREQTEGASYSDVDALKDFLNYLPVIVVSSNSFEKVSAEDVLTFDITGITASGLAAKIQDTRMVNLKEDTLRNLLSNESALKDIMSVINHRTYKHVNSNNKVAFDEGNIEKIVSNDDRISELSDETKEKTKAISDELKILHSEKKELDKIRKNIRSILLALLSRIPLFMIMTDCSEEKLDDIIKNKNIEDGNLFRQVTGITLKQFEGFIKAGLIVTSNMDGYIIQFKRFEDKNYEELNKILTKQRT